MKLYIILLQVLVLLIGGQAQAGTTLSAKIVPLPLIRAMDEVHQLAAHAQVRNLFMFKYAYYQGGFCADQDCSPEFVQKQIQLMKQLMGSDFGELVKNIPFYYAEILLAQASSSHKDVDNLISFRSANDILSRKVFTTCVDFGKAVASRALAYGMNPNKIKFFFTMGSEGFAKMCPTQTGQPAIPPRPILHTIIAYQFDGNWYAMNSENPNPEIVPLGKTLPKRLSLQFIFSKPALVSGLPLVYAGSYEFRDFINGFNNQVLLNIAASGRASSNTRDFVCK
jgi:hypothetical protein